MNASFPSRTLCSVLFSLAASVCLLSSTSLQARDVVRTASGSRGSASQRIHRQGGTVDRTTSVTTPAGKTATRDFHREVDPATRNVSVNASTTLPNGQTSSRNVISTKTDTGRETTASITRLNGKTATVESTTTRSPGGGHRESEFMNSDGEVASAQVDVSRQGDTTTINHVRTGIDGKTVATTRTRTVSPGSQGAPSNAP